MVLVNYNTQLLNSLPDGMADVERGLFYGDALFETIRVFDGRIPLMAYHWDRLSAGLNAMGYVLPLDWSGLFFKNEILRVASSNARVRLTVWRGPGGLWVPENHEPRFLITHAALQSAQYEWLEFGLVVGLCESVRLPVDSFSSFKTLNGPRYIAAAREAHGRGWDDGIVLNAYDRISESTTSNVFWFEGDVLYTPPLSDGCVTGTLRKLLLLLRAEDGLPVREKPATFATVLDADELFLTNAVRGIRWVRKLEGKVYDHTKTRALFEKVVAAISRNRG
jgi:branched-chain amino acid aminotransferase